MRGKHRILFVLICVYLLSFEKLKAQEASFSQFYASSLFINPAFAGVSDNMTISAVARLQPFSSDVTNELQQVSLETPVFRGSASEKKLASCPFSYQVKERRFKRLTGITIPHAYHP